MAMQAFIHYGNKLNSDSTADSAYTSLSQQCNQNFGQKKH